MDHAISGVSRPGTSKRPLWRAWAPWWLFGVTCAGVVAVVDAVTIVVNYRGPEPVRDLVLEATGALGLTLALLSAVALVQAPLLGLASGVFHHRFPREGEEVDDSRLVWAAVAALSAATAASLVARQLMLRTDGFQVRALAVALVGVGAWLGAVGGVGVALGLRKLVQGVWPFAPRPRWSLALLLALVGAALSVVCQRMLEDYGSYLAELSVLVWLGVFAAAEMILGAALLALPRRAYLWVVARARSRWLAALVVAAPTLGLFVGTLLLDGHAPSARRLASADTLSGLTLRLVQEGTDFDRDGASALFGQGDCAPFDPTIGPRSADQPGNGVDENCDGHDADVVSGVWENPTPFYGSLPEAAVSDYNIIVVCFDTVRADHLGFYGHENDTSPYLDSLAAESWVFEDAVAPSATTRMSIASVFSGRYPGGVAWKAGRRVDDVGDDNVFMAEIFQDAGYQTFGVVDEWLPRFVPNMRQGFAKYEAAYDVGTWRQNGHRAGPYIAAKALSMMAHRDLAEPYFLYLHYEAPHYPYQRHPDVRDFGGGPTGGYDAEIAYADQHLGLLMGAFEAEGWLEDTIIVFFSDHGEEFREHGQSYHSRALYEESLRVPLLVHVPRQAPGRFDGRVSLVDILPTLLELTGRPDEELGLHGRSLVYRTHGADRGPERQILSQLVVGVGRPDKLSALYYEDHKLIWNESTGELELFDLRRDPGEGRALDDEAQRESMHERLRTMLESIRPE